MGTGIDHRPGRTFSTGGTTLRSHASFCAVPVTVNTAGTVIERLVRKPKPAPSRIGLRGNFGQDWSGRWSDYRVPLHFHQALGPKVLGGSFHDDVRPAALTWTLLQNSLKRLDHPVHPPTNAVVLMPQCVDGWKPPKSSLPARRLVRTRSVATGKLRHEVRLN